MTLQLVVENLSQTRGGRVVIEALSFRVAGGEALVLSGANGAGKTTLMRTLAGFMTPAAGSVRLEGADPERIIAEQCHFVGHLNGLKSNLTVGENVAFWAEYLEGESPIASGPRVASALEHFAVDGLAGVPAGYLSAGQKRRVALARLLAVPRQLWLLDEPTASLDAASSKLVADAIDAHVAAGGIVIAATHLPLGLAKFRELRLGAHSEAA